MTASFLFHLWLANELNVVEDESAYLMDAWQISSHVLPFREFGATKGPVFLFLLKGWQLMTGQTLLAGRLFPSLLHVISIPLLYLFVHGLTSRRMPALIAAALWGLAPVAVSLTSNVIHTPLELVWILASATLITRRPKQKGTYIWAALFFFLAVLTRVSAATFLPMMLLLISWPRTEIRWSQNFIRLGFFCLTGALLLALTIAIIYPLYGWTKTAFFFNAEAPLIASDVRAAYQTQNVSAFIMLLRGLQPMWREGLPIILLALALPFLSLHAITLPLRAVLALLLGLAAYFSWPALASYLTQTWASLIFFALSALAVIALLFPSPRPTTARQLFVPTILAVWVASFMSFYRFWGRDPTPFYVLETIPAFALAAALTIEHIIRRSHLLGFGVVAIITVAIVLPYQSLFDNQYRGTVAADAARAAGAAVAHHVPEGQVVFTAQPIYAYLGHRPLYKYLTHPGWYLAEHAGIVPSSIRRVFFPDPDHLLHDIERDVDWIITDWRTNDVYFSDRTETSRAFQTLLKEQYKPIVEIPNDVTEPIILYKRK